MKNRFLISLSIGLILLSACKFNRVFFNEKSEKVKAEKITDSLYHFINEQKFKDSENLFSEEFFKITDKAGLLSIFEKTEEILGKYKSRQLIDWKTKRVVGANPLSEYQLIYEVTYENYKARETILLKYYNNGIKIYGYNVNSDGFLK